MTGTELGGRYRVEKALGEGGMGRVYEAHDRELGRQVAVKLLRDPLSDPAMSARFLREARAAAALTHPNACALFELGEHDGQPFLVMELLHGEPLSARLSRGAVPLDEALAIMLPLMSAVGALHDAGLVHRDLKPANVFLTPDGVKLLDFGLARDSQIDSALTMTALTVPGAVAGTLRYMAPEQLTGDPVDGRTDVFALGVLLYETLTGHPPFEVTTNVDWLEAVLHRAPAPLGRPELRAFESIVKRALERRPDDRYASVRDLSAALQAAHERDERDTAATPEAAPAAPGTSGTSGASGTSDSAGPRDTEDAGLPSPPPPSLVVLPFRALRDDEETSFLCEGLPEALTMALCEQPTLRVVSNRAAGHFDADVDLAVIGRELGVQYVLTGTFLRAEHQVRVTAQLVTADDGSIAWSHASQHDVVDVLTLNDDLRDDILAHLPVGRDAQSLSASSAGAAGAETK